MAFSIPDSQINFQQNLTRKTRMPKNMTVHTDLLQSCSSRGAKPTCLLPSKNLQAHAMFLSKTSGSVNLVPVQLSLVSRHRMEGVLVFGRCPQNQLCLALHCTIHVQEALPASGPVWLDRDQLLHVSIVLGTLQALSLR